MKGIGGENVYVAMTVNSSTTFATFSPSRLTVTIVGRGDREGAIEKGDLAHVSPFSCACHTIITPITISPLDGHTTHGHTDTRTHGHTNTQTGSQRQSDGSRTDRQCDGAGSPEASSFLYASGGYLMLFTASLCTSRQKAIRLIIGLEGQG